MSLQHPGVYGIGIGKGMVFWDASRGGVTYSHSQSELPREFRRLVSLYMDSSIHATIHVLE